MSTGGRVARAKRAVERVCASALNADELLEALDAELQQVVPHDGSVWFGLDPVTMLATAPSRVMGMDEAMCDMFWHLEFHEQDTGLFAELARGEGATALRLALDDRPARSIRYRDCIVPQGYDDELRSVFRSGDSTWGAVALYRERVHPAFDGEDVAVMRAISGTVADALRVHVRQAEPWLAPCAPGLLVIGSSGEIVSANAEALDWLRLLWPMTNDGCGGSPCTVLEVRDRAVGVPTPLFALVAKARAVAEGRERGPARLRLLDERGRWVVLHGSALSGLAAGNDVVAVVIEAAKSAEVAPIIVDAYALTPRERDVLGALARGASTAEIAAELYLSAHTVRDYIKTVFEKLGVSSRGELVARLFAEHYGDSLHATMVHVD